MKILIIILMACIISLPPQNSIAQQIRGSNYTLSLVKEIVIQQGEGKSMESFIGVFSSTNDTTRIYQLAQHSNNNVSKEYCYTFKREKGNRIIFYKREDGVLTDSLNVLFGAANNVFIGNDIYTVSQKYFAALKRVVLLEGSVLSLAYLTKDGYGDYAAMLNPANKYTKNLKGTLTGSIISVAVKNKDQQSSDDRYFEYKLDYCYRKDGRLQRILGNGRYSKQYTQENKIYTQYSFTDGGNERSMLTGTIYENKKTLLDSASIKYNQFSTGKIISYSKYQSQIITKNISKKPKNLNEAIRILGAGKL